MGRFITEAKADPLCLKNNVCKEYFLQFWSLIYSGNDDKKTYSQLEDTNVFVSFVNFIRKGMNLNALAKKDCILV